MLIQIILKVDSCADKHLICGDCAHVATLCIINDKQTYKLSACFQKLLPTIEIALCAHISINSYIVQKKRKISECSAELYILALSGCARVCVRL